MTVERQGDNVCILRDLTTDPVLVAAWIESEEIPGVVEAYPAVETVGVWVESESAFNRLVERVGAFRVGESSREARTHSIPVCLDLGPDLERVLAELDLSREALTASLAVPIRCQMLGFSPGFPYLGPIPDSLRGLSRLKSPRVRVEPGSVGLVGDQACIYPSATPGGWNLIGRTPLVIANPSEDRFPIHPGDWIQFLAIHEDEFYQMVGEHL